MRKIEKTDRTETSRSLKEKLTVSTYKKRLRIDSKLHYGIGRSLVSNLSRGGKARLTLSWGINGR